MLSETDDDTYKHDEENFKCFAEITRKNTTGPHQPNDALVNTMFKRDLNCKLNIIK